MHKIIDENYLDLLIDNVHAEQFNVGDNITSVSDRNSILHVLSENSEPCNLGFYRYHNIPAIYSLMSTVSLKQSDVDRVQKNPSLGLYGSGVLVGIIDTGIDYTHEAFLYRDKTSRILSIWDQTIESDKPPEGFYYGTEYTKEQINLALKSSDPLAIVPTVDYNGHGTAIASIIAGSRNQEQSFSGIVTEAELVVVKLKQAKKNICKISFSPEDVECYQETDILLAIKYLIELSIRLKHPIAICLALGTNQGGHDGYGTLSKNLSNIVLIPKIGIAIAAGNDGNSRRHYFGTVENAPFSKEFELRVSGKDKIFAMEIWSRIPNHLSISVKSPTGESTNFVYPKIESCYKFQFIFETTKLWVNNITFEEETGDQLILLRFQDAQEGIWRFKVNNMENCNFSFHSWLPAENLLSDETYFLEPSPDTTISESGNSINALTVTAYNVVTESILPESGRGYTRGNYVKPDVAAPGYEIPCALPKNRYGNITGTGAAASHATGIIAMLLEWAVIRGNYTSITGNDINKLIIRGAKRNSLMYNYPNNIWGYGVIDIYSVFEKISL